MSISFAARRAFGALTLIIAPLLIAAARPIQLFHLALKSAEPRVNDTVAVSPKALKLWFTESVTAPTTAIRLMNDHDGVMKIGAISVDAAPLSPAIVNVAEPLAAGTYTVMWRAMADDGHPSNGKFSFTVK